jgi:hypothetical protein
MLIFFYASGRSDWFCAPNSLLRPKSWNKFPAAPLATASAAAEQAIADADQAEPRARAKAAK